MTTAPFALLLALVLHPAARIQTADERPLEAGITAVTVFPDRALVTRRAEAPAGSGTYLLRGLPARLERASLRVRAQGGDVAGLQARGHVDQSVLDGLLEASRERLATLRRRRGALQDERSLQDDLKGHLQRLLALEAADTERDARASRAGPEEWSAYLGYARTKLGAARTRLREVAWELEDLDREIAALEQDLGRSFRPELVQTTEVLVDLVARGGGPVELELEYLVPDAGWRPRYDLRARSDARSVDLSYRAEVWQETGEDWRDVELALSTARPSLGAQGPDPEPVWVRLIHPQRGRGVAGAAPGAPASDESFYDDAESGDDARATLRFAAVESQGLSVRFRLPRRESIRSGPASTTVLVGEARLAARPEYVAVPALDENVWLQGIATNTSPWAWLPGRAAVFFGADFVGHAQLDLVQPGQELTLHLGADPGLTLTRRQLEDLDRGPGAFSSRSSHTETWRTRLENSGAAAAAPDGSARVFVREAIPRTTDSRIQVELLRESSRPSKQERFARDLEEQGVRTWELVVPRGGEAALEYRLKLSYPRGERVLR